MSFQQSMDSTAATMIERTYLLDKLNFPGSSRNHRKPVKKNDQIKRKTRYYISEQLKYMVQDNTGDEKWLRIIERSCALRDRPTDHILATIENANIPVSFTDFNLKIKIST